MLYNLRDLMNKCSTMPASNWIGVRNQVVIGRRNGAKALAKITRISRKSISIEMVTDWNSWKKGERGRVGFGLVNLDDRQYQDGMRVYNALYADDASHGLTETPMPTMYEHLSPQPQVILKKGDVVLFGRVNGEKTRGKVVKINRTRCKVEQLGSRGTKKSYAAGTVWTVPMDPKLIEKIEG